MNEETSIPDLSGQSEFPAKGYVIEIVTKIEKNLTENEKEQLKNSCHNGETKISNVEVQQKESKLEDTSKSFVEKKERSSTSVCVQCSTENLKSKTPQTTESSISDKNESKPNEPLVIPEVNEESTSKNEEKQICNIEDVSKIPLIEKYCTSMKKCFKKILNKAKNLNNKVHLFGYPCLPYLCENNEPSTSKIQERKTRVKIRKNKKVKKRRGGKSIASYGSIGRRRDFEYPDIEREQFRRSRLRPSDFYLLSDDEDPIYSKRHRRSNRSFDSDLDFYHSYDRVVFLERPERRCLVCKSCVRKTRNPYVYNVFENRNFKTDIIDYSFKYQEYKKRHRGRALRKHRNIKGRKIVQSIQCVLAEKEEKTCGIQKKTFRKSISNGLSKVKCKFRKALKNKES